MEGPCPADFLDRVHAAVNQAVRELTAADQHKQTIRVPGPFGIAVLTVTLEWAFEGDQTLVTVNVKLIRWEKALPKSPAPGPSKVQYVN